MDGQEGRGGSEIWQGQASAGQGSHEPTVLDSGRHYSLPCLEKGRLPQLPSGGRPVCLEIQSTHSLWRQEVYEVVKTFPPPPSWDE